MNINQDLKEFDAVVHVTSNNFGSSAILTSSSEVLLSDNSDCKKEDDRNKDTSVEVIPDKEKRRVKMNPDISQIRMILKF